MRRIVAVALTAGLALAGCTAEADRDQATASRLTDQAHALWEDRTAYIGDNSKVLALVKASGLASMGEYRVSLQTDTPPYAMTVAYSRIGKPFDSIDFTPQTDLLLGLVANLDQVTVTADGSTRSFTAKEATTRLGHDVKDLASNEAALTDHLRSLASD